MESFSGRERAIMDLASPSTDKAARESEAFSEEATNQFKEQESLSAENLTAFVADAFAAAALCSSAR